MAVLMLIVMVFSTFAPIARQAGLDIGSPFAITAEASAGTPSGGTPSGGAPSGGTPSGGTTTSGGLDDITIGTDGKVSFGTTKAMDTADALDKGKSVVTLLLSVCCLVCLAFLILNIAKFAQSGDNEMARKKAIGGMLTTGIGVALLGSVTFWYAFFYNALSNTP